MNVLIVALLSIVSLWWGIALIRRRTKRAPLGAAVAAGLLVPLLAWLALDGNRATPLLASRGAIAIVCWVLAGYWIPPVSAFFAGVVVGHRAIPPWRRAGFAAILLSLVAYTVSEYAQSPVVSPTSLFEQTVCLQTSPVSCSPCCAVTALDHCGIESTEREMVGLCLTNRRGTSPLGLLRGLKLKTRGTSWDVQADRLSVDELRRTDAECAILVVRLENRVRYAPALQLPDWLDATSHAVVMFGFTPDGRVEIGDPSVGRVVWTRSRLESQWTGDVYRLVPRTMQEGGAGG